MNDLHTFVVLAYKESPYLSKCIESLLGQSEKSRIMIATSTPNDYIRKTAEEYQLEIAVNENPSGIGGDFDFGIRAAETPLVTLAHQDDIYEPAYAAEVLRAYQAQPGASIIFTDCYELHGGKKVLKNTNLKIKRALLFLLKNHRISGSAFVKRSALRFGNAISCPAVTYVKENCPEHVFTGEDAEMKSNVDWAAWERLSKLPGYFYYIDRPLMGHRIYGGSTTSAVIGGNLRRKEDLAVLKRFWPDPVAKVIARVYAGSEKSNAE